MVFSSTYSTSIYNSNYYFEYDRALLLFEHIEIYKTFENVKLRESIFRNPIEKNLKNAWEFKSGYSRELFSYRWSFPWEYSHSQKYLERSKSFGNFQFVKENF